jgi:hypothetical protein
MYPFTDLSLVPVTVNLHSDAVIRITSGDVELVLQLGDEGIDLVVRGTADQTVIVDRTSK